MRPSDPVRLSQFLLDRSLLRGVKLHQQSTATSLITDSTGTITAVRILNLNTKAEGTIKCTNLVLAAGAWTPRVFQSLFPASNATFPIYPLAGYSLLVRSPRYTPAHERKVNNRSHAVFTTHPPSCGFSPELFSRQGSEIYIAGLNSGEIPVQECVEDIKSFFEQSEVEKLKAVAVRLMGRLPDGTTESTDETPNVDDLEILREGLCFRPVAERGVPFVGRVDDAALGGDLRPSRNGGVFVAAGHGPWGISLAPGTGKAVADLIRGVRPAVDITGLDVGPTKATL